MKSERNLQPTVSIVVPITRMQGRLQTLRKWLFSEDATSLEIIIVHDIQDALTGIEIHNIALSRPNVQLIEGEYGNPGAARNAGLEIANGDWIAFWDSDDYPDISEFMQLIQNAIIGDNEVAVGGFEVWDSNSETLNNHQIEQGGSSKLFVQVGLNPGIWRWVFRKEVVAGRRFLPIRMAEDQCFLADLDLQGRSIYIGQASIYRYHIGSSLQLTRDTSAIADLIISITHLSALLKKASLLNKDFIMLLILRQIFTGIKKGDYFTKWRIFIKAVYLLPRFALFNLNSLVRGFYAIIRNSKPLISEE